MDEFDKALRHDVPNLCPNCHQISLEYSHYAVQLPLLDDTKHIVSEVFHCQFCGIMHNVDHEYHLPTRRDKE